MDQHTLIISIYLKFSKFTLIVFLNATLISPKVAIRIEKRRGAFNQLKNSFTALHYRRYPDIVFLVDNKNRGRTRSRKDSALPPCTTMLL